jgi:hypothetical protein
MNKTTKRNIIIEDSVWDKLKKLASPEGRSVLIRKILRDYCDGKKD